jgi:hypothetical protein
MNNKRQQPWFPTPEQMTQAVKTGRILTTSTAPDPQKHLEDANKGKVTNFSKTSKSKG